MCSPSRCIPGTTRHDYIPPGESGKSEAWVVLETGPKARIYAGLKPGTTQADLERALASKHVADLLASFAPSPGDAVFVQAGTVHTLADVVVFEVQQNSDVTFRLYDWDHVDPKTGKPRPLQVEQAMACVDLSQVAIGPVPPKVETNDPALRERLLALSPVHGLAPAWGVAVCSRRGRHAPGLGIDRRRRESSTTTASAIASHQAMSSCCRRRSASVRTDRVIRLPAC